MASLPRDVVKGLAARGRATGLDARNLYNRVPRGVKTVPKHVRAFLKDRDISHIKSRSLHPDQAGDVKNVLFERSRWNRSRGGRDMRQWEVVRIRLVNFREGLVQAGRSTAVAATRGAAAGALMELPVAAVEQVILFKGGRKTRAEALSDGARSVGKSAAAGAAGAVVFTGVGLMGVSLTSAVAVPIAVAGGTLYVWSAAKRIMTARAKVRSIQPWVPIDVAAYSSPYGMGGVRRRHRFSASRRRLPHTQRGSANRSGHSQRRLGTLPPRMPRSRRLR